MHEHGEIKRIKDLKILFFYSIDFVAIKVEPEEEFSFQHIRTDEEQK
jgi:hypothetical protein